MFQPAVKEDCYGGVAGRSLQPPTSPQPQPPIRFRGSPLCGLLKLARKKAMIKLGTHNVSFPVSYSLVGNNWLSPSRFTPGGDGGTANTQGPVAHFNGFTHCRTMAPPMWPLGWLCLLFRQIKRQHISTSTSNVFTGLCTKCTGGHWWANGKLNLKNPALRNMRHSLSELRWAS